MKEMHKTISLNVKCQALKSTSSLCHRIPILPFIYKSESIAAVRNQKFSIFKCIVIRGHFSSNDSNSLNIENFSFRCLKLPVENFFVNSVPLFSQNILDMVSHETKKKSEKSKNYIFNETFFGMFYCSINSSEIMTSSKVFPLQFDASLPHKKSLVHRNENKWKKEKKNLRKPII